jgi:hypothetical protein
VAINSNHSAAICFPNAGALSLRIHLLSGEDQRDHAPTVRNARETPRSFPPDLCKDTASNRAGRRRANDRRKQNVLRVYLRMTS